MGCQNECQRGRGHKAMSSSQVQPERVIAPQGCICRIRSFAKLNSTSDGGSNG